ncbi:MAG: hypothetical protein HOC71_14595 [Candidatus Latescibacteria bacterium]|nr:hypothetical protein [Candidatus Latescibacterota bacterium]
MMQGHNVRAYGCTPLRHRIVQWFKKMTTNEYIHGIGGCSLRNGVPQPGEIYDTCPTFGGVD